MTGRVCGCGLSTGGIRQVDVEESPFVFCSFDGDDYFDTPLA